MATSATAYLVSAGSRCGDVFYFYSILAMFYVAVHTPHWQYKFLAVNHLACPGIRCRSEKPPSLFCTESKVFTQELELLPQHLRDTSLFMKSSRLRPAR